MEAMVKTLDLEVLNSIVRETLENSLHITQTHKGEERQYCMTKEWLLSSEMENRVQISAMGVVDTSTHFYRPLAEVVTTFFILGQKYQDEMAKKEILEALQEVVKGVDENIVRDLSGLN